MCVCVCRKNYLHNKKKIIFLFTQGRVKFLGLWSYPEACTAQETIVLPRGVYSIGDYCLTQRCLQYMDGPLVLTRCVYSGTIFLARWVYSIGDYCLTCPPIRLISLPASHIYLNIFDILTLFYEKKCSQLKVSSSIVYVTLVKTENKFNRNCILTIHLKCSKLPVRTVLLSRYTTNGRP